MDPENSGMLQLLEKNSKSPIRVVFKIFKKLDENLNIFSKEKL